MTAPFIAVLPTLVMLYTLTMLLLSDWGDE